MLYACQERDGRDMLLQVRWARVDPVPELEARAVVRLARPGAAEIDSVFSATLRWQWFGMWNMASIS